MPKTAEELALEAQNQPAIPPNPDPNSQNPPSTENQSTNPNPAPVITQEQLNATHTLYGDALREQAQRAERLEKELAEARRNPARQEDTSNLSPEELIRRQVDASVRPLMDEFTLFRQTTQYNNLKNNFKLLPQIAPYWQALEPHVDQEMQGKEPSVQNMQAAVAKVIGLFMMQQPVQQPVQQQQQQIPNQQIPNNQQQPTQPRNDQMLPPHLRPSAPPPPDRSNNGGPKRQLTALEQRVARERGMSDADYLAWIDVDARDVIHSDIGKPKS